MRRIGLLLAILLASIQAEAGSNDVMVDKVWMRESVPGQSSATVQLNLYVTKPAKLLSVSSPIATSGQIEEARRRGGEIKTVVKDSQPLAARSTTIFGEHGLYLNLVGLTHPLKEGERVPVSLQIQIGGKTRTIEVQAEVKKLALSYKHYNDPSVHDHR